MIQINNKYIDENFQSMTDVFIKTAPTHNLEIDMTVFDAKDKEDQLMREVLQRTAYAIMCCNSFLNVESRMTVEFLSDVAPDKPAFDWKYSAVIRMSVGVTFRSVPSAAARPAIRLCMALKEAASIIDSDLSDVALVPVSGGGQIRLYNSLIGGKNDKATETATRLAMTILTEGPSAVQSSDMDDLAVILCSIFDKMTIDGKNYAHIIQSDVPVVRGATYQRKVTATLSMRGRRNLSVSPDITSTGDEVGHDSCVLIGYGGRDLWYKPENNLLSEQSWRLAALTDVQYDGNLIFSCETFDMNMIPDTEVVRRLSEFTGFGKEECRSLIEKIPNFPK